MLREQFLSIDPVFTAENEVEPVVKVDGKWHFQWKIPEASKVELYFADTVTELKKSDDGIFECELPFQSGMNYMLLWVDGTHVLCPTLPIGYGYSRPCNYVELPAEEQDFYLRKNVPHGKVIMDTFFSVVTGEWERCLIYTPAGWDMKSDERIPVLYLQHGHGENEVGWVSTGKVPEILDNLIAEGESEKFAVVMNCGMVQVHENGKRVVNFRRFEDYLLKDVIPFIEERYPFGGSREKRAMAGLSMGSLQTSMIGFRHPEMFSSLGIFSGFLHDWITGSEIDMVERGSGDDEHLEFLTELENKADKAPFDVFFRAIGDTDPFLEYFLEDDKTVEKSGICQVRKLYKGTHDWNVWRMCLRDLAKLLFRKN